MILKSLREKSNQKYINKQLNSRQSNVGEQKIETLGVILNTNEFNDFEAFRELANELKIHPNKIKILAYTDDEKEVPNSRELLFSKKEIGWKAKIKSPELKDFLNKEFDALLGFYNEENVALNLVTTVSKANFKIGISGHDERIFDFIIETESSDFAIFKNELIKYLNILNKLRK
jgi:hypothetical protein